MKFKHARTPAARSGYEMNTVSELVGVNPHKGVLDWMKAKRALGWRPDWKWICDRASQLRQAAGDEGQSDGYTSKGRREILAQHDP